MVKAGEKYKPTEDLEVFCMVGYSVPVSGGHDIILPAGVIFKILNDPPSVATTVYCDPIEHDKWELIFVPEEDREHPKYHGYGLVIDIKTIDNKCEKIN